MSKSVATRSDGRLTTQIRPVQVDWDPMGFALSSAIISTGQTSVLCSVSLEESVPKWLSNTGKGWLSAEYRLLPGSTVNRQSREVLKLSGRTQEIQRLIGRSLRAVIDMSSLGERTLLIDCDVIQADAGTRTAAVTGSWLVLKRGLGRLLEKGLLVKQPLVGQVAAVSVGIVNDISLLDLDYSEDSKADVDLNVVMNKDGKLLEIQGTAEKSPFSRQSLNGLLDLAEQGISELHSAQMSFLEH